MEITSNFKCSDQIFLSMVVGKEVNSSFLQVFGVLFYNLCVLVRGTSLCAKTRIVMKIGENKSSTAGLPLNL